MQGCKTNCKFLYIDSEVIAQILKIKAYNFSCHKITVISVVTGRIQIVTTVMWLGLSDISLEGNWEWNDDTPLSYLNWREGRLCICHTFIFIT